MINIKKLFKKLIGWEEYVSELDRFLMDYDRNHPRVSATEREEIEKYKRIYALRDKPCADVKPAKLWDKF